ncbi:MAG: hypothetical protein KGL35_07545 [Bradyrhizobium sp.]|nr:hypothetical protein [Bradyrhizobium sp.]
MTQIDKIARVFWAVRLFSFPAWLAYLGALAVEQIKSPSPCTPETWFSVVLVLMGLLATGYFAITTYAAWKEMP